MTVAKVSFDVELATINCGECGGTYAINERYRQQKAETGGYWNCPYCRCSWGYGEGERARLQKELDLERKRKQWAVNDAAHQRELRVSAEYRERAQKAAKTRLKNRIASGVCPCCTRSFQNLAQHMKNQHPEFAENGHENSKPSAISPAEDAQ